MNGFTEKRESRSAGERHAPPRPPLRNEAIESVAAWLQVIAEPTRIRLMSAFGGGEARRRSQPWSGLPGFDRQGRRNHYAGPRRWVETRTPSRLSMRWWLACSSFTVLSCRMGVRSAIWLWVSVLVVPSTAASPPTKPATRAAKRPPNADKVSAETRGPVTKSRRQYGQSKTTARDHLR